MAEKNRNKQKGNEKKANEKGHSGVNRGNREYKSDVFCMLLENPENALALYNAVNHSDYKDPKQVKMCRLDRGISLSVQNDASFILGMDLNIYEHQSTVCQNMPLRSLIYVSSVIADLVRGLDIHGYSLIRIPTPRFVVFYNGRQDQPEVSMMQLSDAYEHKMDQPELELICKVYNINAGKNKELLEQCRFLREYAIFVERVRGNYEAAEYQNLEWCINEAIDYCIREYILRDFLIERRVEVIKMMTLDYTFERRLELQKEAAQREIDEMRKAVEEAVEATRREAKAKKEAVEAARREAEAKKKAVEAARREAEAKKKAVEAARKEAKEAHAAGITEGREDNLWSQIQKKLIKGKTTAQIADELETTEEEITEIIQKRQLAENSDTNILGN